MDAVRQLLKSTQRDWYEIKVIDLPQAVIVLHARALLLISAPAIALVNAAELQAMAAHEIGHEIRLDRMESCSSTRRSGATQGAGAGLRRDCRCHLAPARMDPSKVIDGVEKVTRFNRELFGSATNEMSYPTLAERRAFAREIDRWLRDSAGVLARAPGEIEQIA